jgi:hypothetical protein
VKNTKKSLAFRMLPVFWVSIILVFALVSPAFAVPSINPVSPVNFSQSDTVTEVSATVYGATAVSRVVIDGNTYSGIIADNKIRIVKSFTPGLHNVYIVVTDSLGNTAERTWEFYVNDPVKKYLSPDNALCTNCHSSTWKNFPGHLVDYRLPLHPHSCGTCHLYLNQTDLIVRSNGSTMAGNCTECHNVKGNLYLPPVHGSVYWKGTWSEAGVTIKAPRSSFDCQYCHQPGTSARMGHDLVSDHKVDESQCVSCHGDIMTVIHNTKSYTCNTCHQSNNPLVQNAAKSPMVAKAGTHYIASTIGDGKGVETYFYQYFNDLNLSIVSLTVYGPNKQDISSEWTPGAGFEIKRIKVDDWKSADRQYVLAYVQGENKWYTISVADEGKVLYKRYPVSSPAREIYLPRGTTKIKTKVISGPGDSTYSTGISVKEAYYNKPAKCTDCHVQSDHETVHSGSLNASCLVCHQSSLTKEHMNNPKTQTKVLTCDTCHKSTDPVVSLAITNNNISCTGCHVIAHNFNLADYVPVDVILDSRFSWSTPINANIWAGDSWMPAGMATSGKVLMSNQRSDITVSAMESSYNSKMRTAGWTVAGKISGTGYIQLKYSKSLRLAYVFWYNGAVPNTGNSSSPNYRLLILYN